MKKYLVSLLVSALCASPIVYSQTCTPNNSSLTRWEAKWPTQPRQVTPGTQGFCSDDGGISNKTGFGPLTRVIDIRSYYTNQFVPSPSSSFYGYHTTFIFLELSSGGVPFATLGITVDNYLNSGKPCRISTTGGTGPNQTTFVMPPNLDGDINLDAPGGRIIVEDNFIYGPENSTTGLFDLLTNLRNTNFSTPGSTANLTELYYYRVDDLATCSVYSDYMSPSAAARKSRANKPMLPDLEADLNKVWTLANGVQMTGAQIRKALAGY